MYQRKAGTIPLTHDMCVTVYCAVFQERPNMRRLIELYEKATTDYGTDHPGV